MLPGSTAITNNLEPATSGGDLVAPSASNDPIQAMADEALQLALSGQLKRGLSLAISARKLARDANNRGGELTALIAASRCNGMNNDYLAALSSGVDALTLAAQLGDGRSEAHAWCSIATSAFTLQLLEEACPLIEQAIARAVELQDNDLEARARQIYGENLGDLERFDEARRHFTLALDAIHRLDDLAFDDRIRARLGMLAAKQARFHFARGEIAPGEEACEAALQVVERLLPAAQHAGNGPLALGMTGLEATVFFLRDQRQPAEAALHGALATARRLNFRSPIPPWSLHLATLYRRENRLAEARTTLEEGLRVAESLRPTFRVAELCEALAQIAALADDNTAEKHWRDAAEGERQSFERERVQARRILTNSPNRAAGAANA